MKNSFIRLIVWSILLILPGVIPASNLWAAQSIGSGELFPEVPLPAPLEAAQRTYLGLANDHPFTLQEIEGRVALVEILNVHCPHCIRQTKPYSELYDMIEADPETRGKIKIIGVAVANDDEAIDDFVVIYGVHYPILSDHDFKLHSALRAGATPFSLYLVRDKPGESFVITDTHLGNDFKMDELFTYLKDLLTMSRNDFFSAEAQEQAEKIALTPPQSEEKISTMIKDAFAAQGKNLSDFHKLDLPSGRRVYTANLTKNGQSQPIFAEVNSRSAICDVCHDVHFFYVFNRDGLILDFVPLQLTKHGNEEWSQAELNHFTRNVIGKKLDSEWNFDPKVDAVASATMTSVIIFDDLGKGRALLEELKKGGFLQP